MINETQTDQTDQTEQQEEQFDEEALAEKIGPKLAALGSDDAPDEDEDEPEDEDTEESESEEESEGKESEESEDEESETEEESDEDESTESEESEEEGDEGASGDATIPVAQRRSLKAYGWTDEEIDKAAETSPEGLQKTAERVHSTRTSEIEQWAKEGRKAKQEQTSEEGSEEKQGEKTGQGQQTPQELQQHDTDALRKQLVDQTGDEELADQLINSVVAPVNKTIEQLNAVLPQLQEGAKTVEQSQQEQLGRQIDEFFGRDDLKGYHETYGTSWDSLNDQQLQKRNEVLELADAIMAGAGRQGRDLTVEQALEMAHDSVTADQKEAAARRSVKKQAKTRSKGKSLKPSKKGQRQDDSGPPSDESEFEARTSRRLQKAFGGAA